MHSSQVALPLCAAGALPGWRGAVIPAAIAAICAGCFWFIVGDVVVASTTYLLTKAEAGAGRAAVMGAGHLAGVIALAAVYRFGRLRSALSSVCGRFERSPAVVGLLLAAALVRLLWVLAVPAAPYSDGAVYDFLARGLVESGVYDTGESRAYWPPGYPFWLAGIYWAFGHSLLAAKLSGIFLCGLSEWCCWRWLRRYTNPRTAAVGLLLLVCWPSRTLSLDILSYDALVVAAVLASLVVMPDVRAGRGGWCRWVLAGLLLGAACFTRATLILVIVAVAAWMVLERVPLRRILATVGLYTVATALVLVPWSVRNYQVFQRFVPLTSNGGVNLYHSFAPGGDGGYCPPAVEQILARAGDRADDELARDAAAYQLTAELVRKDPRAAVHRMLIQKAALYLGSDNCLAWLEAYEANWPEAPVKARVVKAGGLFVSNGYYLALLLCPLLFVRRVAERMKQSPVGALGFMVFFSGFLVHTVFQAQSRYHLVYLPFWAVCLAVLLSASRVKRPE